MYTYVRILVGGLVCQLVDRSINGSRDVSIYRCMDGQTDRWIDREVIRKEHAYI